MAGARATRIGCAGGMVLLDDRRQRLFAFNRTADAIWRLWDDGLAPDEIAALLADAHGIAPPAAKADVARIVDQWRTAGLIGADPRTEERRGGEESVRTCRCGRWPAP